MKNLKETLRKTGVEVKKDPLAKYVTMGGRTIGAEKTAEALLKFLEGRDFSEIHMLGAALSHLTINDLKSKEDLLQCLHLAAIDMQAKKTKHSKKPQVLTGENWSMEI